MVEGGTPSSSGASATDWLTSHISDVRDWLAALTTSLAASGNSHKELAGILLQLNADIEGLALRKPAPLNLVLRVVKHINFTLESPQVRNQEASKYFRQRFAGCEAANLSEGLSLLRGDLATRIHGEVHRPADAAWNLTSLRKSARQLTVQQQRRFLNTWAAADPTASAREMRISESALKRELFSIQNRLGVRLIQDAGKSFELTDAGIALGDILQATLRPTFRTYGDELNEVIDEVRRNVPEQLLGPLQFEIESGILKVSHQSDQAEEPDKAAVDSARAGLLEQAERLASEMDGGNSDRRLFDHIQQIREKLCKGGDIIQLAMLNILAENVRQGCNDELSSSLSATIQGFTLSITMYVAQFPSWQKFVENAVSANLDSSDIEQLFNTANEAVTRLEKSEYVDPEVPKSISILATLIANPLKAARNLVFAVIRTLENLIAKVVRDSLDLVDRLIEAIKVGAPEGMRKVAKWGTFYLVLSLAVKLSPIAGKVPEMIWLKAVEAMERRISEIAK